MNNLSSLSKKPPAWTREFDSLVRSIGECKSKAEEDLIIDRESDVLKLRLKDAKLDKKLMKEILVRLIYVEMLGHDASWGHVKALQACSETALVTKKVAYLASSLFLDCNSDLIVLVVNTLQRDLKSDNYIIVCTALTALCKLLSLDLINAVIGSVVELLKHPKELVRKKAVMALHRFQQLDPKLEGPLHNLDVHSLIRESVRDKDVSVMGASLCALQEVTAVDPQPFKPLVPSLISILKQVADHRLPKGYDYHKTPAPFIQIKLLRLLSYLGAGDKAASDNMYAIIAETIRRANTGHTIGNAIIFECVRTITTIYPNPALLHTAAETIGTFLKSSSHNLKYIGIDALARIVRINAKYAAEHQMAVIDCLEDPDETLKNKTLHLLHKMTKPNNVEVIVGKMMDYLKATSDDVQKLDAVKRIHELAERFAPDMQWFLVTMNQVFELGGDVVPDDMAFGLLRLIAEGAGDDTDALTELRSEAVQSYLKLLSKSNLPDVLLKVICWVLGEYGSVAREGIPAVMSRLSTIPDTQSIGDDVRACLISALGKLGAQSGKSSLPDAAGALLHASAASHNLDLQQRALEALALLSGPAQTRQIALPYDSMVDESDVNPALSFLDAYVSAALQQGAAPYLPEAQRASLGVVRPSVAAEHGHGHALRFEAYAAPKPVAKVQDVVQSLQPAPAATSAADAGLGSLLSRDAHVVQSAAPGLARPPAEPQLELKSAGARRWGPAQYTPAPTPVITANPTPFQPPAASSAAPSQPVPAPLASTASPRNTPQVDHEASSGRRQLAASLFGDAPSAQPRHAAPKAARPASAKPQQAQPQPAAVPDLMGELAALDVSPQPSTHQQPSSDPFAAMEGLSTSAPSAAPAAPTSQPRGGLLDLDALYSMPTAPSAGYAQQAPAGQHDFMASVGVPSSAAGQSMPTASASPDLLGGMGFSSNGNTHQQQPQNVQRPAQAPSLLGQPQAMAAHGPNTIKKPAAAPKSDPFADLF